MVSLPELVAYSQLVRGICLLFKGSENLSYLTETCELSFLFKWPWKMHPTQFIRGMNTSCFHLVLSNSCDSQNPDRIGRCGPMAGSKGRGTSRSMWELCFKIDPSHTHHPFKINKQRIENESTSLCNSESKCSIMIWQNASRSQCGTSTRYGFVRLGFVFVLFWAFFLFSLIFFSVAWLRCGSGMRQWPDGLDMKLCNWCEQDSSRD